jgi:3-dehydroquinate synthase
LHGEAVGCGMVMAADLSVRLGLIAQPYAQRIRDIIERAGLPVVGPALGTAHYLELMRLDKKSEAGEIRFVVIEAPGRAALYRAPDPLVEQTLEAHTG